MTRPVRKPEIMKALSVITSFTRATAATGYAAVTLAAMVSALSLATPRVAQADASTYSSVKREFKVGVLLLDSTIDADGDGTVTPAETARGPENPDPYVFYIADSRIDLKPQNWDFVNPLAPAAVTGEIKARWDSRHGGGGNSGYQVGQKIQKDMAAYWEVYLSQASVDELLQFDCLFITHHRTISLSPSEREKLRKVVDAGGIVWIEDCGNMRVNGGSPFFLEQLQFSARGAATNAGPVVNVPSHPLLNNPFRLQFEEIANLGDKNYANYALVSYTTAAPAGVDVAPNPETLINIVGNRARPAAGGGFLPYIAAGNYGSGAVIITAGDSGCDINDYTGGPNVGSGGNSGAFCGKNLNTAHTEDLKFLYNLVSWGGANNSDRRNSRRTASSLETIGSPLVRGFDFTSASAATNRISSKSSPLVVKNILFISGIGANGVTVSAYDLNPYSDADGDGNYDDGIPDISRGLPFDEIWRWEGGAAGGNVGPSAPVYATFTSGATTHQRLFVTLPNGSMQVFELAPEVNGGLGARFATTYPVAARNNAVYNAGATKGVAPAPVYFEGKVFTVEADGQVVCRRAFDGAELWHTFDNVPTTTMTPTGSPTLGLVRQTSGKGGSGANAGGNNNANQSRTFAENSNLSTNDLMLYVPVEANTGSETQARVMAYWLGTRNEVQSRFSLPPAGANGMMDTRVRGNATGGPQAGQYFVAIPAGTDRILSPFVVPRVRVFSRTDLGGGTVLSARECYNQNRESVDYAVTSDPQITPEGQVQISLRAGSTAPAPQQGQDILIAVDYDVAYITAGGAPLNYTSNATQVGARNNTALFFRNYTAGTMNTAALSPEDLLLFGMTQSVPPIVPGNPTVALSSFVAINEQEGGASFTKMRWRFSFFGDAGLLDADGLLTRTVDTQIVQDIPPLRNYLQFDPAWPAQSRAVTSTTIVNGQPRAQWESLQNTVITGAPITTNYGITYVLAGAQSVANGPVSVLMAFKTNPQIILQLPDSLELAAGVTVLQADASDPTNVVQTSGNQEENPNFRLDANTGRVTLTNFNVGDRYFSASQSFVVRYTPRGGTQPVARVIAPFPPGTEASFGKAVDANGEITGQSGGFTPLLWYYVLPGTPVSAPALYGDYIHFTINKGGQVYLLGVDANPAAKDPTVRPGFGEQVRNVVAAIGEVGAAAGVYKSTTFNHARTPQLLPGASGETSPPVGSGGSLAINTAGGSGTYAFQAANTLVADAKRVIEAGADGEAIWTLDATITRQVVGGELPQFNGVGTIDNPPARGRDSFERKPINRPSVARRLGPGEYMIVDSGNNRVVRTDRSGEIRWSLEKFADPYGVLAAGDPRSLNNPSDVQTYIVPTFDPVANPNPAPGNTPDGYEIHYIVTDAGNNRIIEVADYYDANGRPTGAPGVGTNIGEHIVVFSTRTTSDEGRNLRFQSLQRFLGVAPAGAPGAGLFGFPSLIAVVGNATAAGSGSGPTDFTGGSLVNVRYVPYNTVIPLRAADGTQTYTKPWPYNGTANARTTEGNAQVILADGIGNGRIGFSANTVRIRRGGQIFTKTLNRPSYLQQITRPDGTLIFLICDAEGVYAAAQVVDNGRPALDAIWYFTQEDYDRMMGVDPNGVPNGTGRLSFAGVPTATLNSPALLRGQMPKFVPSSVKLLPSGNLLIANSFAGRSILFNRGQFTGEAFEVDPAQGVEILAYVLGSDSVRGGVYGGFSVPRIQSAGLNDQVMGNPTSNTNLVEQPLFADRP